MGTVEVSVRGQGYGPVSVATASEAGARPGANAVPVTLDRGSGRCRVALGGELEVVVLEEAGERPLLRKVFTGPVSPDQIARVEVGPVATVVTGRLVDPGGAPLPGRKIVGNLERPQPVFQDAFFSTPATTGADGRFRMVFAGVPEPGTQVHLSRRVFRPDGYHSEVRFAAVELPPGDSLEPRSLGDIEIGDGLVLTGTVVGPDGSPQAGVLVGNVVRHPNRSYSGTGVQTVRTAADGRFELVGSVDGPVVSLGVTKEGHYVETEPTFPVGARDVVVTLSRAGGLAGSLSVPDGLSVRDFDVVIQGEAQRNHDGRERRLMHRGLPVFVAPDGRFEEPSLRPGQAAIRVMLHHTEVMVLSGFRIVAGETNRDSRLQDIDTEPLLRTIVIKDSVGPVPKAVVHWRPPGANQRWSAGEQARESGVCVIPRGPPGTEVLVTARVTGALACRRRTAPRSDCSGAT